MNAPALPQTLKDNPRLDRWVRFEQPGKATVSTGKVEIGQGVLTAMLQIAAEELDVAPSRILLRSGDTEVTPNEGYTSGSLSIQIGGVALRAACAEVKQIFLDHAAAKLGADARTLSVRDGAIFRNGEPTGLDYWSLANEVDLTQSASGRGRTKSITDYALVGQSAERIDLADKVFGRATYIHDMTLPGMRHARVIRQPNRGAAIETIDEDAIRRAARGPVDIVRRGDFVAIVGEAETAVELAAGAAPDRVRWSGVEPVAAFQEEARWLLQRPSIDRVLGAPEPDEPARGVNRHEATYSRGYVAHASLGPSCGLAQFKDGRLEVWTHSQGVFPLRMALARTLKLPTDAITVKHVQGPGCYGHNGADDAAADAAVIAFLMPGVPIRVRWRREEEFGFEPVSSAMVVTVRAELDDAGRPADWTTEVWSGTHS
ncbi:MAG: molybdopterin-dependent oxidoreductase, partial [Rhizobiales bacterium]|nr:molybdopterin-dependent oxidoreductase [Hyphomicrobiales bacterium]